MSPQPTRGGSALLGFALAGLPGSAAVVIAELYNPAFADDPWSLWLVALALPGLVGLAVGLLLRGRPRRWHASLVLAQAAVVLGLSMGDGVRPLPELRLVVLGIDGATWDVADPLIAAGQLPHLARLRREGASGTLRAHEPMFSPLLWTTLATGLPPEAHGVRGFRVHADDCLAPRFFDIAEAEGHRLGLYKWLVTWPPRQVDGFIVPAWLAPSPETTPPELSWVKEVELSRRLERQAVAARRSTPALAWAGVRGGLRWSTLYAAARWTLRERLSRPDADERALSGQLLRVRMDRDAFVFALRRHRPSVATFTTYATDALGHRFWREHEPEAFEGVDPSRVERYADALPAAYRQADAVLGEVLRLLPPAGRLVVLSDHGFQALDAAAHGTPIAPRTERLEARLGAEVGPIHVARTGTRVVVTLDGSNPAEQREDLERSLAALVRGSTGEPFFRWSLVHGSPRAVALDIADARTHTAAADTVGGEPLERWARPFEGHWGDHHALGIFAAWGDGVAHQRLELDALDLAPTALAALGIAPGEDMPGRAAVWPEPPRVDSWAEVRADLVFPEVEGDEVNEDMLEALGYLDLTAPRRPPSPP